MTEPTSQPTTRIEFIQNVKSIIATLSSERVKSLNLKPYNCGDRIYWSEQYLKLKNIAEYEDQFHASDLHIQNIINEEQEKEQNSTIFRLDTEYAEYIGALEQVDTTTTEELDDSDLLNALIETEKQDGEKDGEDGEKDGEDGEKDGEDGEYNGEEEGEYACLEYDESEYNPETEGTFADVDITPQIETVKKTTETVKKTTETPEPVQTGPQPEARSDTVKIPFFGGCAVIKSKYDSQDVRQQVDKIGAICYNKAQPYKKYETISDKSRKWFDYDFYDSTTTGLPSKPSELVNLIYNSGKLLAVYADGSSEWIQHPTFKHAQTAPIYSIPTPKQTRPDGTTFTQYEDPKFFVYKYVAENNIKFIHPTPVIVSVDIETFTANGAHEKPDPRNKNSRLGIVCMTIRREGIADYTKTIVMNYDGDNNPRRIHNTTESETLEYASEQRATIAIEDYYKKLRFFGPVKVIGFHSSANAFGGIPTGSNAYNRAMCCGYDIPFLLSRIKCAHESNFKFIFSQYKKRQKQYNPCISFINITGLGVEYIDVMPLCEKGISDLVRADTTGRIQPLTGTMKMNNVLESLGLPLKMECDIWEAMETMRTHDTDKLGQVVEYCQRDTMAVLDIVKAFNTFENNKLFAEANGLSDSMASMWSQAQIVSFSMLRAKYDAGEDFAYKKPEDSESSGSYIGGLNDTLYEYSAKSSAMVDAVSMYPNMIAALNISAESFRGMTEEEPNPEEFNYIRNDPSETIKITQGEPQAIWSPELGEIANKIYGVPLGAVSFVKFARGLSAVPSWIYNTFQKRQEYKKNAAEHKKTATGYPKDSDEYRQEMEQVARFNALQYGLKININMAYGLHAHTSFPAFNKIVAASTTLAGRKLLREVIGYVQASGRRVLFCDTDSVGIECEGCPNPITSKTEADTYRDELYSGINQHIQNVLTQPGSKYGHSNNSKCVDMAFETYFKEFITSKVRKNYTTRQYGQCLQNEDGTIYEGPSAYKFKGLQFRSSNKYIKAKTLEFLRGTIGEPRNTWGVLSFEFIKREISAIPNNIGEYATCIGISSKTPGAQLLRAKYPKLLQLAESDKMPIVYEKKQAGDGKGTSAQIRLYGPICKLLGIDEIKPEQIDSIRMFTVAYNANCAKFIGEIFTQTLNDYAKTLGSDISEYVAKFNGGTCGDLLCGYPVRFERSTGKRIERTECEDVKAADIIGRIAAGYICHEIAPHDINQFIVDLDGYTAKDLQTVQAAIYRFIRQNNCTTEKITTLTAHNKATGKRSAHLVCHFAIDRRGARALARELARMTTHTKDGHDVSPVDVGIYDNGHSLRVPLSYKINDEGKTENRPFLVEDSTEITTEHFEEYLLNYTVNMPTIDTMRNLPDQIEAKHGKNENRDFEELPQHVADLVANAWKFKREGETTRQMKLDEMKIISVPNAAIGTKYIVKIPKDLKPFAICPICDKIHKKDTFTGFKNSTHYIFTCWSNQNLKAVGLAKPSIKIAHKDHEHEKQDTATITREYIGQINTEQTKRKTTGTSTGNTTGRTPESTYIKYELHDGINYIRANMGSGKTYQLKQIIEQDRTRDPEDRQYNRIVMISPRCTFAQSMAAHFGITHYKSITGDIHLSETPQVMIQIDSLHRLKLDGLDGVDLVVFDEMESTLNQITIRSRKERHILDGFVNLINHATCCVVMDAFLSCRTVSMIKKLTQEHQEAPKEFDSRPFDGYTLKVYCRKKTSDTDEIRIIDHMIEQIKTSGPVVSACTSRTLANRITEEARRQGLKVKLYTGENQEIQPDGKSMGLVKKEDFENINQEITTSRPDLLIYTGTMTCGISIDIKYFKSSFHILGNSENVLDFTQAMARVRDLSTRTGWLVIRRDMQYKTETYEDLEDLEGLNAINTTESDGLYIALLERREQLKRGGFKFVLDCLSSQGYTLKYKDMTEWDAVHDATANIASVKAQRNKKKEEAFKEPITPEHVRLFLLSQQVGQDAQSVGVATNVDYLRPKFAVMLTLGMINGLTKGETVAGSIECNILECCNLINSLNFDTFRQITRIIKGMKILKQFTDIKSITAPIDRLRAIIRMSGGKVPEVLGSLDKAYGMKNPTEYKETEPVPETLEQVEARNEKIAESLGFDIEQQRTNTIDAKTLQNIPFRFNTTWQKGRGLDIIHLREDAFKTLEKCKSSTEEIDGVRVVAFDPSICAEQLTASLINNIKYRVSLEAIGILTSSKIKDIPKKPIVWLSKLIDETQDILKVKVFDRSHKGAKQNTLIYYVV